VEQGAQGVKGTTSEVMTLHFHADVGFFVLEFDDPTGQDAVPGAEQTVPIEYDFTQGPVDLTSAIDDALEALRLLLGPDDVTVTYVNDREYTLTFNKQIGDLPTLLAFDTSLLLHGGSDGDQ